MTYEEGGPPQADDMQSEPTLSHDSVLSTPKTFTTQEAADFLGVPRYTFYRLARKNLVVGHQNAKNGQWLFMLEDLLAYQRKDTEKENGDAVPTQPHQVVMIAAQDEYRALAKLLQEIIQPVRHLRTIQNALECTRKECVGVLMFSERYCEQKLKKAPWRIADEARQTGYTGATVLLAYNGRRANGYIPRSDFTEIISMDKPEDVCTKIRALLAINAQQKS